MNTELKMSPEEALDQLEDLLNDIREDVAKNRGIYLDMNDYQAIAVAKEALKMVADG